MENKNNELKRSINLFGGVSILTGIMVGSGIFFIGSYVLLRTEFNLGVSLLVWLVGGLITMLYGLMYAELGAMMPSAGGYYVYLREAFGEKVAFLSGFMNFTLASSGSIAALAIAFGLILNNILGLLLGVSLSNIWLSIIGILLIGLLSLLNYFGIHIGALVQKVLLVVKAIPIFLIVVLGLFMGTNDVPLSINFGDASFFSVLSIIGFAVIATFWAYEGWTNLNNVAGEVKNPGRNIPLSLIISIGTVTVLYVLYQYSLFRVLSVAELRSMIEGGNIYVGIDAAYVLIGSVGMYIVIFTMLISVFGALNGSIIVFPRVYYAMSKDGLFFSSFSKVSRTYQTPIYAIIGSGVMAVILMVFGLDDLISLVAFGGLAFNILIFASLFVFRKTKPDVKRPYKVWLYPYSVGFVILITFVLLVATYVESFTSSLIGTGLILLGIPVYFLFKRVNSSVKEG